MGVVDGDVQVDGVSRGLPAMPTIEETGDLPQMAPRVVQPGEIALWGPPDLRYREFSSPLTWRRAELVQGAPFYRWRPASMRGPVHWPPEEPAE